MDLRISIVDEQLLERETISLLQALQSGVFNGAFAAAFGNNLAAVFLFGCCNLTFTKRVEIVNGS